MSLSHPVAGSVRSLVPVGPALRVRCLMAGSRLLEPVIRGLGTSAALDPCAHLPKLPIRSRTDPGKPAWGTAFSKRRRFGSVPWAYAPSVGARRLCGVAVLISVSGCGLLPWTSYGDPHPNCMGFDPEVPLEWAGHGTPDQFGLYPTAIPDLVPGDIYVGMRLEPNEPDHMWCHVADDWSDTNWGAVPEDWAPPP